MTRYPQVLVNFAVRQEAAASRSCRRCQRLIASVESAARRRGRVLVRYSGTESKARVMIEGIDEIRIRAQANEIAEVLKAALLA